MVGHRFGWIIFGLCSVSSVAHAGGTSSESGSSESSGGESTSDATTGTESSDGGETLVSGDLTDSDSCGGTCGDNDGGVLFDAPTSTDVVSPFVVTVTPRVGCSCDTCGCFDDDAFSVHIELDGESVGSCSGDGQCTIEVSAPVGEHELRATAEYSFHGVGDTITINVTQSEVGATETSDTAESGSQGETTEGLQGDDDNAKGCGCTASDRTGAWWIAALAIVVVRRRRPGLAAE